MNFDLESADESNLWWSKEAFKTIEVTGGLSCKATEIRSAKFKSLHQSWTPYSSGVFAWKYIRLNRVFNLFLFWKLYSFPSIAPIYFLFLSPGWQKILIDPHQPLLQQWTNSALCLLWINLPYQSQTARSLCQVPEPQSWVLSSPTSCWFLVYINFFFFDYNNYVFLLLHFLLYLLVLYVRTEGMSQRVKLRPSWMEILY